MDYRLKMEIDIVDLLRYIYKHWLVLLITSLIGVVLAEGYLYHETMVKSKTEPMKYMARDYYRGKLSSKEALEVDNVYRTYVIYEKAADLIDNNLLDLEKSSTFVEMAYKVFTMQNLLNADQKNYYNSLFEDDSEIVVMEEGLSKTRCLLGSFIVGGCFGAIFLSLKYILSGKLKSEQDIRHGFGLPIIGVASNYEDDRVYQQIAEMSIYAVRASGAKTLMIVSSIASNLVLERVTNIIAKKNEIDFCLYDLNKIDILMQEKGQPVILFERIGESKYKDIEREIEICNMYGTKIIGAVVINSSQKKGSLA